MQYVDTIMVLPEGLDEFGNPSGNPAIGSASAVLVIGEPYFDEDMQQKVFLCRVRIPKGKEYQRPQELNVPAKTPVGSPGGPPHQANPNRSHFSTPTAFKTHRPDLWKRFNMNPRTITVLNEEGLEEQITITPQAPVFL